VITSEGGDRRLATITRRPTADQRRLINRAGTEIDDARRRRPTGATIGVAKMKSRLEPYRLPV